MTHRKLIALNTIHLPDGTAKRPKRIDGRAVVDNNGKVIEEEYTVVAMIPPAAVFVIDDEEVFASLKRTKSVSDADADAKVTFFFSAQKPAESVAPVKTGRRSSAKADKAKPEVDTSDEDLV